MRRCFSRHKFLSYLHMRSVVPHGFECFGSWFDGEGGFDCAAAEADGDCCRSFGKRLQCFGEAFDGFFRRRIFEGDDDFCRRRRFVVLSLSFRSRIDRFGRLVGVFAVDCRLSTARLFFPVLASCEEGALPGFDRGGGEALGALDHDLRRAVFEGDFPADDDHILGDPETLGLLGDAGKDDRLDTPRRIFDRGEVHGFLIFGRIGFAEGGNDAADLG